jgi:hypothetical protein
MSVWAEEIKSTYGSTYTQRKSAVASISSSVSSPMRNFRVGPTIVPSSTAVGKSGRSGVPGVTAWESEQVRSVKTWRFAMLVPGRATGLATVAVARPARMEAVTFMMRDESSGDVLKSVEGEGC